MRDATPWPYPSLTDDLLLPATSGVRNQTTQASPLNANEILHGWARFTGARGVLIAPNLHVARRWVLRALRLAMQSPLLLPPNATHELVESVKQCGFSIRFGRLDADLCLHTQTTPGALWLQPPLGLPACSQVEAGIAVAEYDDTLPGGPLFHRSTYPTDVAIFGLHLSTDPAQAGALVVFGDEARYRQVQAQSNEVTGHFYDQAAQQLARLQTLAPQQHRALETLRAGVQEAAGLPVLSMGLLGSLAHGIALRVPPECSAATFWHYVQGENTPLLWLSQLRPIHYAAAGVAGESATHLERWFVAPAGPQNDLEAGELSTLGIVKTAEFLGMRWRTDPARAARYADLLVEKYGPDHDAYRPVFATDGPAQRLSTAADDFDAQDLLAPVCRLPG